MAHHHGKLWDDDDARNLQLMVDMVHEHGALAGTQLGYSGNGCYNFDTRIAARGVEQMPSESFIFHSCYAMSKREIRELQRFYADAAVRAMRIGFDVIQVSASHAYGLPQQFLMPRYNHRTDEYGGLPGEPLPLPGGDHGAGPRGGGRPVRGLGAPLRRDAR